MMPSQTNATVVPAGIWNRLKAYWRPKATSISARLDEDMEPVQVVFTVREAVQIEHIARLVNEPCEKVVHDAVTEWMMPAVRAMAKEREPSA